MSTQSPHNFKLLYDFTVHVSKEIEREETVTEGDVTTIKKTKVVEPTPTFYCFKKPSRFEREEAEVKKSGYWTHFVKAGVLPEAILLREYANWGGILNDFDKEKYGALRATFVKENEEYERTIAAKDDAAALKHLNAMFILRDQIVQFEREQNSFFENTAEAMARNKYVQYCLLHFSYKRDSLDKPWEPVFKGVTTDDRYDALEALEETKDEGFQKAGAKLLLVSSLYVAAGAGITREDIEAIQAQQENDNATAKPAVAPPADVKASGETAAS